MNPAKPTASEQAGRSLVTMYESWKSEDREIEAFIDELQSWMYQVAQMGHPHFGETATRLRPLQEHLWKHFENERRMLEEITQSRLAPEEVAGRIRTESVRDRDELFSELDNLIDRLNQVDPPFDSWQRAVDEVRAMLNLVTRHEESEAANIQSLISGAQGR